mmetsp:Transcript_8908/g.32867  ORF Transcript_8908/g.32867 Transcript_8908/m.32867 type:complete len:103 (-) Transcript_8908:857-1165(-)
MTAESSPQPIMSHRRHASNHNPDTTFNQSLDPIPKIHPPSTFFRIFRSPHLRHYAKLVAPIIASLPFFFQSDTSLIAFRDDTPKIYIQLCSNSDYCCIVLGA